MDGDTQQINMTIDYKSNSAAALISLDSTLLFAVLSVTIKLVIENDIAVVLNEQSSALAHSPVQNLGKFCFESVIEHSSNRAFFCPSTAFRATLNLTALGLKPVVIDSVSILIIRF